MTRIFSQITASDVLEKTSFLCRTLRTVLYLILSPQEGEDIILLRARKYQKGSSTPTELNKHYYVLVRRPVEKFEIFKFVVSRELNSRGGRTAPKII
jgi:hypothetical protein